MTLGRTGRSVGLFIVLLALFEGLYLLTDQSEAVVIFARTTAHLTAMALSVLGEAGTGRGSISLFPSAEYADSLRVHSYHPNDGLCRSGISLPFVRIGQAKGSLARYSGALSD